VVLLIKSINALIRMRKKADTNTVLREKIDIISHKIVTKREEADLKIKKIDIRREEKADILNKESDTVNKERNVVNKERDTANKEIDARKKEIKQNTVQALEMNETSGKKGENKKIIKLVVKEKNLVTEKISVIG
jgi:hypothetical protein